MKAKSLFSIICQSYKTENPSILDVATKVYLLFKELSEFDSIFNQTIHFNGSKETIVRLDQLNAKNEIAQLILNSEWSEITKYEGTKKPTIGYKRLDNGFSFNSIFYDGSDKRFVFNLGSGYSIDGVSFYNFNREYEYDYEWYEQLIKRLVKILKPFYATVILSNQPTNIFYNQMNIRYPIGWITYFSNTCDVRIPDDLREVRYQFVEEGKYLYTSDQDFMKDKEAYFGNREKLERIITEVKERVPEFSKSDN